MTDTPTPELPPCGLYRTTRDISGVPEGRLVYFHNHGKPGPGVYLPESWHRNRARFSPKGTTLPALEDAGALAPLPAEGLYVVNETFTCCEKRCVEYQPGMLVQLGYQASAQALLFVPEWRAGEFILPERGNAVDTEVAKKMTRLRVPDVRAPDDVAPDAVYH